jgi:ribonuclease P protein component
MLPKKHRLSKKEFNIAFKQRGQFFRKDFLKLKIVQNDLGFARFGISCGVKISNKATKRNLIKRRISDILHTNLKNYQFGYDVIVMPDPIILEKSYQQIKDLLITMLRQPVLFN